MDRVHLRILLAEDDEDDFVITRGALAEIKDLRCEVDWASTYDAAAERLLDDQHDVYLFDYALGAHNGLDLLRVAREHGCFAPIIMLTGHTEETIIIQALTAGATDYLVKGHFDAEALGRSIRYGLERKRTEMALKVSEERFRNLLDHSNDMVFSYDWQGQVTAANRSMEKVTGYARRELVGMRLADLFTAESLDALEEIKVREIAGERTEVCQLNMQTKPGATVEVELNSRLISAGSRPVEFQVVGRTLLVRRELVCN